MDRNTNKEFFNFLDGSYREVREKLAVGDVLRINRALSNRVWDKSLADEIVSLSDEIVRVTGGNSPSSNIFDDVLIATLTPAVKNAQRAYLNINKELTDRFH